MALRKPLVLNAGTIQQIQSGDTLDATVAEQETIQATNGEAVPITIGQVVYISAANTVKLAKADAASTALAIGVVADASIAAGNPGGVKTAGVLSGLATLTAGAAYYLSAATGGLLTSTAPSTAGQYVVKAGIAVSTTEFQINIERPILL